MLDHVNSEISQIAHVLGRTFLVKPGEKVKQGQVLCKAGGRHSAFPHLHWAIRDSWSDLLACGLPIKISECSVYETPAINQVSEATSLEKVEVAFVPHTKLYLQRGMIVENRRPNNARHADADKPRR